MNMTAHKGLGAAQIKHGTTLAGYVRFASALALAAWGGLLAFQSYSNQRADAEATEAPDLVDPATAAAVTKAERDTRIEKLRLEIARNPLDDDALTQLSLLLGANGQQSEADRLALLASERSIRNITAQLLALDINTKKGELDLVLKGIDGLVRSNPGISEQLFDQLFALALASKDGEQKLVELLASNPPWRQAFLARVIATQKLAAPIYNLFTALKSTEAPPSDPEVRGFLARLIKAKDYAGAHYLWLDMLSDSHLKRTGNVFDSGFDVQSRNLFFDWTFNRSKTVDVKTVPRATGSSDRVLRIDFIGNRNATTPVYQYLRLQPGEYIFSGEQQSENLKTDAGLVWQVQCVDGNSGVLVQSPKLSGNTQWTRFDVRMTVPVGCTTQFISLRAASSAKLDQQISGMASFDNIAVTAIP